jgi:tetratricopeptide (TPR) repeat protein
MTAQSVRTTVDLAQALRRLRRREARRRGGPELTYRELATRAGWSHAVVADYFTGKVLPPIERFDALVRLLGASPVEQGALATLRDEVEDHRRRTPAAAPRPPGPVPRHLPRDVFGFTGRAAQLAALDDLLDGDRPVSTVVVAALSGTPGVGKTALAVHWAHHAAGRFPDGQLYVNLRGYDPGGRAVSPADAVRGFLDALEVAPERIPVGLEAQAGLYRSLLAGRRVLVLLDNARNAEQVRPLLPGAPGCVTVVTSRDSLAGLVAAEGAHPLLLDLLTRVEARDLLARRLGRDRVAAEPAAVEELIDRAARLPLALAIVAARAAVRPGLPLSALAGHLRDARARLDVLGGPDAVTDVRSVFSWSYAALTPPGARLFRLLGPHPAAQASAASAASLAGVRMAEARRLLGELTGAHLLAGVDADRFELHDLLKAYAAERAEECESAVGRRAAVHRVLDHYLHTAHAAALLLHPHRDPLDLVPARLGVTLGEVTDHAGALAWFTAEHQALLAAVDHAAAAGLDRHAWQLAWTLTDFFARAGHWSDWASTQHAALAAATRLGDLAGQAQARRSLGAAYDLLRRRGDAHTHLRRALDLFAALGDLAGQGHTHHSIALVYAGQGRYREAVEHGRRSVELFRATRHRPGEARALNTVGWHHAHLGEHRQALAYCERALALHRELGDPAGQAATWDSLGFAHHRLGAYTRAAACYERAIDLCRELRDRYTEAAALRHLGDVQRDTGDVVAARRTFRHAATILDELAHPEAAEIRAHLRDLDAAG